MTETEAERPARAPMDIGQLIVDRAKPVLREGGYAYEGPLVAEKWTRLPDGDFLVLLKLGNGDRYMHLRCVTLYPPPGRRLLPQPRDGREGVRGSHQTALRRAARPARALRLRRGQGGVRTGDGGDHRGGGRRREGRPQEAS